jgi:MFS family permease
MVGTLPGRTQGLGLITEPLLADLQLSRIDYASINLWATLIGSLFCLPCGRLVDRAGSRVVLTGLAVALGLTVVAMGQLTGMIAVAAAITLTRGFGQSALSVVSLALVGKWFNDRISYAMGVYSLLVGIGFVTAFPLVGQSVLANGWRFTWTVVGWSLLLVLAPLAWLFVRNGLAPTLTTTDRTVEHQDSLTLAEALRSPSFWVFALASSLFGLVYSGISLFNPSILEQRGFDATVAAGGGQLRPGDGLWPDDGSRGRRCDGGVFLGVAAGLWKRASGAYPGRGANDDGAGVRARAAGAGL